MHSKASHCRTSLGLVLAALLAGSCKEPEVMELRPADVPKSPPAEITRQIGSEPMITTSGSPPPAGAAQIRFEEVVLFDDRIEARSLIPRQDTLFRIRNRSSSPRQVRFEGDGKTVAATSSPLPPGEEAILQIRIDRASYTLMVPGTALRKKLETYRPN